MPTKQQVVEVLKTCLDPEIGIDIWTLELIYDIKLDGKKVHVKMTFTSPMCPYGPVLVEEVKRKVGELDGVENVDVEVVFDPPWEPSDELKATLGIGV
ncbi:metal-sulfur cluster assembly factor [Candidatus Woesearchaeota archaeon]|nr:metal-sulfur cluster assembly factor [Candidatus Woesearchaeota archaeon]